MEIANYPKYLWINSHVVSKDRKFPLIVDRSGKYDRVFLEDVNGNTRFVSTRELKTHVVKSLEKTKSKGRIVTHISGKVFGTIKEARDATGLSDAKLKAHPEYTIA
jgi:hypothetical protein